jgi:hypothetical protein
MATKPRPMSREELRALTREQVRLFSEVDRSRYYLAELPENYEFPVFNGKQAVESQRRSGYRTTARAAREIVDNALEAGAKNVWVVIDRLTEAGRKQKHQRANTVMAVAFIDDGPGMLPEMARYALTWGGGTHHKDPTGIGRFGFGLPNSSINQTKRVEVYTKTEDAETWSKVFLDIKNVSEFGKVNIDPPEEMAELPGFVTEYMGHQGIKLKSGTVVVWDRPDRLTYNQAENLKGHLHDDFGTTYRYLLPRSAVRDHKQILIDQGKFRIFIEDKAVDPVDPLFLTEGAKLFKTQEDGGARYTYDRPPLSVKYYLDPLTGAKKLQLLRSAEEIDVAINDQVVQAVGTIRVKVARFPYGFVIGDTKGFDKEAQETKDGVARFEIRKARRGMSFIRAGREIDTEDVFPKSSHDKASGLGDWPLLQGYAYHWSVEVTFDPELDDVFGVGNDKQTIRPIDDFWRVMVQAEVDKALREEQKWQSEERRKPKPELSDPALSTPAAEAAAAASRTLGRNRPLPPMRRDEANAVLEEEIQRRADLSGESVDKVRKTIEEEAKRKRYAIEFFESRGGVFYEPGYGNGLQRVARVNKLHPFFEVFYARLATLDPVARNTVDLLLLALADAELAAGGQVEGDEGDELRHMYETQRESVWSPFLKTGLKKLEEMQSSQDSHSEE